MKKLGRVAAVVAALALIVSAFASSAFAMYAEDSSAKNKIANVESKVDFLETKLDKNFWGWRLNDEAAAVAMKANGEFRVRGVKVNSVSVDTNMVNVTFYGFTKDVSVAGAKLYAAGKTIALADIKAGDLLAAKGTFDASNRNLTVSEVHDLSFQRNVEKEKIQNRINELLKLIEQLKAKLGQ